MMMSYDTMGVLCISREEEISVDQLCCQEERMIRWHFDGWRVIWHVCDHYYLGVPGQKFMNLVACATNGGTCSSTIHSTQTIYFHLSLSSFLLNTRF